MTPRPSLWPDRPPSEWVFVEPVKMTLKEFQGYQERNPHGLTPPYDQYKWRIERDGRKSWHLVARQYSYGQPIYFAQKIIITLSNSEGAP